MDEITLTQAGWAWKVKNFIFAISGNSKFRCTNKHSNTCHGINFYCKLIFLNAPNNVLYQNQFQLQLPKSTNYRLNDSHKVDNTTLT